MSNRTEILAPEILAPEILAHLIEAPALCDGALAVWTDYRGRKVGVRIVTTFAAGEISTSAGYRVRSIDGVDHPYGGAFEIFVDAATVRAAI